MIPRRLLLVVVVAAAGCSHPLASLAERIERSPLSGKYAAPQANLPQCLATVGVLQSAAAALGVPILYEPPPIGDAHGSTDGRTIWIHPDYLSDACGHVEVLAHELGHVLQPPHLTARERQLFADGVSIRVVQQGCGYDPSARYAQYLSVLKPDARILTLYRREIEAVASALLTGGGRR